MLTGSDPDGDPITFSIVDGPAHGTLIGAPPALTYVPAPDYNGTDAFTFVTNDGRAQSEPAKVAVKITEVNDPPVLGPITVILGGAGTLPPPGAEPKCGTPCGVFWGDVHNITFDRAVFDFQAVGEFVGVKSTTDDFELQIRTAPWSTRRDVSIMTAVAMRVNHHRVALLEFLPDRERPVVAPKDLVVRPGLVAGRLQPLCDGPSRRVAGRQPGHLHEGRGHR